MQIYQKWLSMFGFVYRRSFESWWEGTYSTYSRRVLCMQQTVSYLNLKSYRKTVPSVGFHLTRKVYNEILSHKNRSWVILFSDSRWIKYNSVTKTSFKSNFSVIFDCKDTKCPSVDEQQNWISLQNVIMLNICVLWHFYFIY